jgi:hypothetical protein
MKRCPTCNKTFDDNMRFCQADGTPLIEEAPMDPYKTMVARPEDIAAATASSSGSEDVLDLPSGSDSAKTMYASEEEIRAEMEKHDDQVIDIPPLVEPQPPSFSEPTPPPSPFSNDLGGPTGAPIPSPFDDPKPSTYEPPPAPSFADPEPIKDEPAFNPFDQPAPAPIAPAAEWTPPPAPDSAWQNQQIGQNTPFQPPAAGTGSVNQTLPIVSLVFGIVSLCCYISPLTGLVALITGYMGLKNINNDPQNYGGKGLAIAGMITGGVFFLLGAFYWIYIIFVVGLAAMGSLGNI